MIEIHSLSHRQMYGDIDVQLMRWSHPPADLVTKSVPTSTCEKMVYKIRMRRRKYLKQGFHQGE